MFVNCQSIFSHFITVHSWSVRCSQKSQKSIKTPDFGSSGLFRIIDVDTTEKLVTKLVVISSMPMPICNHVHKRLANDGKITTFRGYRYLMPLCTGFFKPRKLRLGPSKFTFNAGNFIHRFYMSISIDFGTIRS